MKKNFFPSERRKRRKLVAQGRNQLQGKLWKHPKESWRAAMKRYLMYHSVVNGQRVREKWKKSWEEELKKIAYKTGL